ncbi:Ferri-bacillibactin esterase BesA [Paenibacillus solanacearum]|uniref:Ferri-bacillibactin esterase BesA n=1 Tax=Paenibacillus solanacearum TaxID=2048548 RepID=A0A916K6Z1_9BACL|nr:alpha/beta hydrolase [Paenibacillus solanacearum]CAG7638356.1 Ferri-bacillibactin esterase BesA [Paenibacillus solanacearum]
MSAEFEKLSMTCNPASEDREVTIPRTVQRVMRSRSGNRAYRISVAVPAEAAPSGGYPVIYVLDANSVFGTMTEAVRVQGRRPERTGVDPAIVVGIGYETDAPFADERYYDFTPPVSDAELPKRPDGKAWPEVGGAEAFLTFIEDELKPAIEGEFAIDASRQTIFGHSLGGLFVLHALFTRPGTFRTYIAGSPSIHWSKRLVMEEERAFAACLEDRRIGVNLLIAVGELERSHPSGMNRHAEEMADRLSALADAGLRVEFKQFEGEGHVSVLPGLISRALRFALAP